jgi:hypothetical protein
MEIETNGATNEPLAIKSLGIKVQNPIKNKTADTKTEGTKALVFVETNSPAANTINIIVNAAITLKAINKAPFKVFNVYFPSKPIV